VNEIGKTAAAPEAPRESPAPLRTLGRWVVALLVLMALVDALAVVADLDQIDVYGRLLEGEDVSFDEAVSSDDFRAVTGLLQVVANLAVIVMWLVWFRRAYLNIPRLTGAPLRFAKGWAIGAWFVPILNFFRPKQMANDIWRAGEAAPDTAVPFNEWRVSPLLHWWWGVWLVTGFVANGATRLLFRAETVADQNDAAKLLLWSDLMGIVLDIVAIAVVVQITGRYERRRSAVAARQSGRAEAGLGEGPPDHVMRGDYEDLSSLSADDVAGMDRVTRKAWANDQKRAGRREGNDPPERLSDPGEGI
jgi:hypothetical protein